MSLILETVQTEGIAALSYLIGDDQAGEVAVIDARTVVEEKVITKRVAACTPQICEIAGVRPDGPTGQWIAEVVQNCCEEELDEALAEA